MRRTPSYLDGTTVAVSNTQNHRKNIIFSLVAALVVALLAACGQSTPGAEPQDLPEQPQLEDVATLEWNSVAIGYEADAAPIELSGLDEAVELIGSGADIWGTSDEFFFTYTTLEGDGALTVRLDDELAADTEALARVGPSHHRPDRATGSVDDIASHPRLQRPRRLAHSPSSRQRRLHTPASVSRQGLGRPGLAPIDQYADLLHRPPASPLVRQ